ncbi:MAG: hypothetical protein H8E66_28905 [Planctomycetes bacterium]|nr:hypothetical protein [Planctomycetota bacterium]
MQKRFRRRRGVVLLIVLSLLVLFTLMAVTFVVISAQYRNAAIAAERYRKTGDDPRKYFDVAISQLIRDTGTRSSLNSQSLLRDLYGTDFAKGKINTATTEMGGEFLLISVSPTSGFSVLDDSFVGCVITMLNGDARGLSSRIVDYDADPGTDAEWGEAGVDDNSDGTMDEMEEFLASGTDDFVQLRCEAFRSDTHLAATPGNGDSFLINGRPFNGTGYGYDTTSQNLDGDIFLPGPDRKWGDADVDDDSDGIIDEIDEGGNGDDEEVTNWAALFSHAVATYYESGLNSGGADESWDAVDFQNMYLAMVPPDLATVGEIIPSFHRPSLLRYVFEELRSSGSPLPVDFGASGAGAAWSIFNNPYTTSNTLTQAQRDFIVDVKRACTFRPLPEDHPNFSGSNSAFHFLGNSPPTGYGSAGAWDVDNDGDATADSIWIDIGLPVQTSPSGKLYKPLVAILCQDLDGRLNLNAHGNLAHDTILTHDATADEFTLKSVTATDSAGTTTPTLPRGTSFGPAEVALAPAFAIAPSSAEHKAILEGRYGAVTDSADFQPGRKGTDDTSIGSLRTRDLPNTYAANARSSFSSRPDMRGIGGLYLDHTGHPKVAGSWAGNERVDDPYEILLKMNGYGDTGRYDRPYTFAELERVLRFDDYDAWKLPTRLIRTAPNSFSDNEVRRLITVHSSYLPAPKHGVPRELWARSGATTPTTDRQRLSILDLFVGKLRDNSVAEADIPSEIKILLPFELQHGELLNINRLLGNGIDDDGDGTVDERGEKTTSGTNEQTWPTGPAGFAVKFEHQNDDPVTNDTRQILARHLFCLLMAVIDEPRYSAGDLSTLPSSDGFVRPMATPEVGSFALDTTLPQTAATLAENQLRTRALVALTVRRYAQWAVNAVDFRDSDAIMTGFEYDPNPFDGWQVDGNLATNEGTDGVDNDGDTIVDEADERAVVWGVEYPDLLLTEATAFHDRRVKDTDLDTTGLKRLNAAETAEADNDLDQYRIPQGSLFLEFYCPRPRRANNPVVPGELYTVTNNEIALDLTRVAPANTSGRSFPVWRVAISASHQGDAADTSAVSPLQRTAVMPHTTSFEPTYLSTLAPGDDPYQNTAPVNPQTLAIERQIWFTSQNPTSLGFTAQDAEQIFYNRSGNTAVQMRAGGYLVVGPRKTTRVGSNITTIDMPQVAPQRIVINDWSKGTDAEWGIASTDDDNDGVTDEADEAGWPGSDDVKGLTYYNAADTASTPSNIRTALSAVIAANPPPFWTNAGTTAPEGIGVNVSEPLPINVVRDAMGAAVVDAGNGQPIRVYYQEPTDRFVAGLPFDSYHTYSGAISPGTLPDAPFDSDIIRDSLGAAVPEAPASTRPLVTDGILSTDTSSNHRTAFVQRLADPTRAFDLATNPYITIDWSPIDLTVFNGEEQNPPSGWDPMMIVPAGTDFDPDDPPGITVQFNTRDRNGTDTNIWAQSTRSPTSQGTTGSAGTAAYFSRNLSHSLGYLNSNAGFGTTRRPGTDQYRGDPTSPFPWLTVNNRPYASPMELLLVPSSSPSRLFQEFGVLDQTGAVPTDPYPDTTGAAPYSHLLNFFHETTTTSMPPTTVTAADLYRLLDFVETPSQYPGTEKWYRPATFTGSAAGGNTFRPPYNRLSRFRDPGRVNINTIFDSRIWEGIAKTFPGMDPTSSTILLNNLNLSRQGYGDDVSDILAFGWQPTGSPPDVYYPTRFANPFRSAFSADLMPDIEDMRKQGVDATWFRRGPFDDTTTSTLDETTVPLFAYTANTTTTDDHINTDRNAYFRYQGYQQLGNKLSTTSNVFAIWMTVGFFEVEENLVSGSRVTDAAHPDGYRLGIELGRDTGEVKRHRAFYIVDRSIPVAFEPDKNHNIDRAILMQRFIE